MESKKQKKTPWELLNSPFVLFILSSFILGGITFIYNEYSSYKKKSDDTELQLKKIITELKFRADVLSSLVQAKFTYGVLFSANGAFAGDVGNKDSNGTYVGSFGPIYPEFLNRNMISLLWELGDIKQEPQHRDETRIMIDACRRLLAIWDVRTERLEQKREGKFDSIWHFTEENDLNNFRKDLRLLQTGLERLSSSPPYKISN